MQHQDFTATFLTDKSPKEAFDAINNVRGWWKEEIEGSTEKLNDEFSVRFGDVHYSKQKLIEVVPEKKVVWLVTESNLTFIKDHNEWTGTTISFDISKQGDKTQVRFTHHGLVPAIECYDGCSNAWGLFVQQSLFSLITTGKGRLNVLNQ